MIQIKFPDASVRRFESGITVLEVAKNISEGLARNVLSAKFNEQTVEDLLLCLKMDTYNCLLGMTIKGKDAFWHSSAHVLHKPFSPSTPKQN